VLELPIFPRRAFHTFNWSKESHITHFGPNIGIATDSSFTVYPIRLSGILILKSFLRRWLYVFFVGGLFAAFVGSRVDDHLRQVVLISAGGLLILVSVVFAAWLKLSESRTRRIRRLLGRHRHGSSDPATWTNAELACVSESQQLFGFPNYEAAVYSLLETELFSKAMWAARLAIAKENRWRGEFLTNEILWSNGARRCLLRAEENPKEWIKERNERGDYFVDTSTVR
jgi:hypothetical protein